MRSDSSDLIGLPDIYGSRIKAPVIGRAYPYQSVTDQQNERIIRKLINRNHSMEQLGVDGNQIVVNLGIGGS